MLIEILKALFLGFVEGVFGWSRIVVGVVALGYFGAKAQGLL